MPTSDTQNFYHSALYFGVFGWNMGEEYCKFCVSEGVFGLFLKEISFIIVFNLRKINSSFDAIKKSSSLKFHEGTYVFLVVV